MESEYIKENKSHLAPLAAWWLWAGLAASALALGGVALLDGALPAPLPASAPPERFSGHAAHRHLRALTALGPRVAGSYENEVLAVAVLVRAARDIAARASPHNRVELDVHTASGAFALDFMDGMNNVYRDVQSVVLRVRGAGGPERPRRALLLNCHYDTVPDSPGASDDGAGCAVLLEVVRALAAAPRPLRHDAVLLLNGAEENIMQASHAFVTQHRWARHVRAFLNLEACGAGGREVLFQAGPRDPWIVEEYARAVPHPFASSLAQELFESGAIPADTDFRIFRDFGALSGLDLAWSSNGYVYHTRLDTAERVAPAVLQRTGDNVLALARALLAHPAMDADAAAGAGEGQPVFFDVLGLGVVAARGPAAALAALAALALLALKIHLNATDARDQLFVSRAAWWARVGRAAAAGAGAAAAGAGAAGGVALLLHAAGARLACYARPALLAPLYGAPALGAAWALGARWRGAGRGWWAARAWHDAGALAAGALLALCLLRRLRSGFVPLLWVAGASAADALASALRLRGPARACLWAAGAALPALKTWYLALGLLRMLLPLTGRAGSGPPPADLTVALLTAALLLAATSWLLPLLAATRSARGPVLALGGACAAAVLLVLSGALGRPYSAERPQRLMVFHTRRTEHAPNASGADAVRNMYWIPDLDANTPHTVMPYARELSGARALSAAECRRWPYCGAPYYLPVLRLVRASHAAPARAAPLVTLRHRVTLEAEAEGEGEGATLHVRAEGAAHVVLVVAPAAGVELRGCSALARVVAGAEWRGRRTYFIALHAAREPRAWSVRVELRRAGTARGGPAGWAHVSLAGHALFGAEKRAPEHEALLGSLPDWVAATGWGADLHLYSF